MTEQQQLDEIGEALTSLSDGDQLTWHEGELILLQVRDLQEEREEESACHLIDDLSLDWQGELFIISEKDKDKVIAILESHNYQVSVKPAPRFYVGCHCGVIALPGGWLIKHF